MTKILKNIGSLCIGFFLVLFFSEFFLRFTEIKIPYKTLSEVVGKTFLKNAKIHVHKEGLYIGKSNKYGFLGKNYTYKKPDSIFRIALLGDSYTEGFQLKEKYHFSKILETSLNELKNHKKVEVLNFGISSSTLIDSYIRKIRLADKFSVDLFLFVMDQYDFIQGTQGVIRSVNFSIDKEEILVTPNTSNLFLAYKRSQFFVDNSALLHFVLDAYLIVRRGEHRAIILDKFYDSKEDEWLNDVYAYYTPYFKNLPEHTLVLLKKIEKEKNIAFVINDTVNKYLFKNISRFQVEILSPKDALDSLRNEKIDPYFWGLPKIKGHLNKAGNKAVGRYLYHKIKNKIPLKD